MPRACMPLFEAEAWDLDLLRAAMAPDCFVRIGNGRVATSREEGLAAIAAFFGRVEMVGTGYLDAWPRREALIVEIELRPPGPPGPPGPMVVPCVVIARVQRHLIRDLRFYLDTGPTGAASSGGPLL